MGIIQLCWVWQWIIQLCWVVRNYVILRVGNLLTPSIPYLTNDSTLFFDCHSYYVSTWIVSAWRPKTWALRNILLVCPSDDVGYSLTWNCKGGEVLAFYGGIVPTLAPFLLYFSDDVVCECSWEVFKLVIVISTCFSSRDACRIARFSSSVCERSCNKDHSIVFIMSPCVLRNEEMAKVLLMFVLALVCMSWPVPYLNIHPM